MNLAVICLIGGIIGLVFCAMALRTGTSYRALLGFTLAVNINTIIENLITILKH